MLAILQAAGWPVWPLVAASIIALGIVLERTWVLRRGAILPAGLLEDTLREVRARGVSQELLDRLTTGSPMGVVLAAGLRHGARSRVLMRESLEDAGRRVAHELGRFLPGLGTIASISPIMGLFGTVVGMIEIFGAQNPSGASPAQLAHGISVALYNTAFGLMVAVPSMILYRTLRQRVEALVMDMEAEALRMVDALHPPAGAPGHAAPETPASGGSRP